MVRLGDRAASQQGRGKFYKKLRVAAELSGKGKDGAEHLEWLVQIGKMPYEVIPYLRRASIIEMTGWTTRQIGMEDARDMRIYEAIWGARGGSSRQERKMLT